MSLSMYCNMWNVFKLMKMRVYVIMIFLWKLIYTSNNKWKNKNKIKNYEKFNS